MDRFVGVKCYGVESHGLSPASAAKWFSRNEIDWVLMGPKSVYRNVAFRSALRDHGVKYFETAVMFHDPELFAADPSLRPVNAAGDPFPSFSWYAGICPSHQGYVLAKVAGLASAAAQLSPDGLFLSFIRFPGFWELWMDKTDVTEYCFCDRCLALFQSSTGLGAGLDRAALVAALQGVYRPEWTAWKCSLIASIIASVRAAIPGIPVLLNGFGLGASDFGNAVEHVLAQRFTTLDPVTDFYELMFYFQIQRRDPVTWIPQRLAEARLQSGRPVLACLQAAPEYLDAKYGNGRAVEISDEQWRAALRAVSASSADGVTVYSWRDLLADESRGGRRLPDLRDYRNGLL